MGTVNGFRQGLAALIASVAAIGLFPGGAAAKITRDGIAGVKIGMNEDEVRATLGKPTKVGSEGGGTRRLDYRRRKLNVLLYRGAVIRVRTTSRAQRTPSGIGAGVSEAAARRKLRGERCSTAEGTRVCVVENDDTILVVASRGGRVTVIDVSAANVYIPPPEPAPGGE